MEIGLAACLVLSLFVAGLASALTVAFGGMAAEYERTTTAFSASDSGRLVKRMNVCSIAARLLAAFALMPSAMGFAFLSADVWVNNLLGLLGPGVVVGLMLVAFKLVQKIPIRSLWKREISWPRQVGLALLGGLVAWLPMAVVMLRRPPVWQEIVRRLSGSS